MLPHITISTEFKDIMDAMESIILHAHNENFKRIYDYISLF